MIDMKWLIVVIPIAVLIGYSTGMIYTIKYYDNIIAWIRMSRGQ